MTSSPGSALVVGGSIAGLFAALLLRRRGWTVQVIERAGEALSGRGAGIVTYPELYYALAAAGVALPADFGVEVQERRVIGRDGATVASLHRPQIMTSWDRLWRLLRAALPDDLYQGGAEVREFEQDGERVRARLVDGRWLEADALIGADGLRSAVRGAVMGEVAPSYAGYTAWRGLVAEAALPPSAHAALFEHFVFCLPAGEQMLGYPVAGPDNDLRPGHRRYNWVWYRPADAVDALPALMTDRDGIVHSVSIPPPLIRPAAIAAMREAARRLLPPVFADIVDATARPFLQPIFDLESPRLASGRVALIGDAAFVARPHVGAGTTKAALDAVALADALDRIPVAPALAAYAAARRPEGQRILQRARHLGAYMQAHQGSDEERAAALRHHTPQAVLEETATLAF